MRSIVHPMPRDFVRHMHDTYDDIMARYNVSENVVRRWISETGIPRRAKVQEKGYGAAPASFTFAAKHMNSLDLSERYGVSDEVIRRWKRENGIPLPSDRVVSNATFERARVDTSVAERAADYLRRDRWIITRRDEHGRYDPAGYFWLCGTKLRPADDLIAFATSKGFNADAWKQVAA